MVPAGPWEAGGAGCDGLGDLPVRLAAAVTRAPTAAMGCIIAAVAAAAVSATARSAALLAAVVSVRSRVAPAPRVVDAVSENGAIAEAADVGRDNGCGTKLLEDADPVCPWMH